MSQSPIEISIAYRRAEYIQFLKTLMANQVGKITINRWYFKLVAYPYWILMYYLKMYQEGQCFFRFDPNGFIRISKTGKSGLEWNGLKKIVVQDDFYLLVGKRKGMAPIPKRCLSKEQINLFEDWAKYKLMPNL